MINALVEQFVEKSNHFLLLPAMLDVCRRKAEESGITSRCTFHEGYLDSLPASDLFDAATCLLVSQFLKQAKERSHFFGQIAQRLPRWSFDQF
jgi:tRNA (cmo5U34)-methyltransferase